MVCNAGLVSGIRREKLLDVFSNHTIHQIFMVPGKSYSFIQFASETQAREAINAINGKVILAEIRGPLYLLPIEKSKRTSITNYQIFDPYVTVSTIAVPENYSTSTEIKPQGLTTITDFITEEEEKLLVDFITSEFANSSKYE